MTKHSRALIIILAAAIAASCDVSTGSSYKGQLDNLNANWSTLEDGSKFALVNDPERQRKIAMRCWPQGSSSHLCISVEDVGGAYSRSTVSKSIETSLPEVLWGLSGEGYRCASMMGLREEVADGSDALISNKLRETGRPWSRAFVNDYIAQNKVKGAGHFRCLDVLRAVLDGSPKTLGTTSISRAMAE